MTRLLIDIEMEDFIGATQAAAQWLLATIISVSLSDARNSANIDLVAGMIRDELLKAAHRLDIIRTKPRAD